MRPISRRRFNQMAPLAAASLMAGKGRAQSNRQPGNIVLIVADDLGYGDLSCYGSPDISTPHIDGLAGRGVRFANFYANAPECTPTRTALLTGRYQHRVGGLECALGVGNVGRYDDAIRLRETHDMGLPASEETIAQCLSRAGYATGVSGKWHLGYEEKFLPAHHGFGHFFGVIGGNADYFFHAEASGLHTLSKDGRLVRRDGHLTDLITEDAVDFLYKQDNEKPFFLYVPYTAPHSPYQSLADKTDTLLTEDEWNQGSRETYKDMIEQMDAGVGRILRVLNARGWMDDTLVIFMSDNGANQKGSNQPFSGFKGGLYEGGIHVPCVAQWNGVLPERTVSNQVCMSFDLTASMLRAAGQSFQRPLDGMDILAHVEQGASAKDRALFWRARRGERTWKAVRDGAMKYLYLRDGDEIQDWLFDLNADPAEQNDLKSTHGNTTAMLKQKLAAWEEEVKPVR